MKQTNKNKENEKKSKHRLWQTAQAIVTAILVVVTTIVVTIVLRAIRLAFAALA